MTTTLSPRPAPPNEQLSSRTLHPIYQALDSHNYTKALKLTSSGGGEAWDIVRSLRVHALERSGKKREALVLLWEILVSHVILPDDTDDNGGEKKKGAREVWSELYDRIESLSDATDLVNDGGSKSNNGLDIRLLDAVQRLDIRGYTPIELPKEGNNNTAAAAQPSSATKTSTKSSSGKRGGKAKASKKGSAASSNSNTKAVSYPPVSDETVLQTLCVTLRAEGLYDTMSEMYFQAMETLSSTQQGNKTSAFIENYRGILEEGVCVHFKAVCDCSDVGVKKIVVGDDGRDELSPAKRCGMLQAQLPILATLLNLTKYYERMQTSSLQLAKLSSQPLHFQWTAISSLWYRESLEQLVLLLENIHSLLNGSESTTTMSLLQKSVLKMLDISKVDDIPSRVQKLQQKMALLPRLAESLSSRMVLKSNEDGKQQHAVSENDWDVYLETLLVQNKKEEALEVLKKIQCTPMNGDASSSDNNSILPQIDDEHTIENHVGSILPYTQRKKLERCAQISQELGMHEEAEGYYRQLLKAFPDQWTYWMGLVSSCVKMAGSSSSSSPSNDISEEGVIVINEEGWQRCRAYAQEVISIVESSHKYALRGPYLILVELASMKVTQANAAGTSNDELVTSLRDEICTYGNKFGPVASCCFADVRSYLQILVKASSSSSESVDGLGNIQSVISNVLEWAKEMWTKSSQSNTGNSCNPEGEVSTEEFKERRKKIRTYIFAVQVVYAIAVEYEALTGRLLESYAPSLSQLVIEWRTSLSFLPGVAPKDGGQKEVLPGDELMLLTSQYLQFQAKSQSSSSTSSTKTSFLLQAAGLLEEAIDQSPYNPHLKIAAIGIYSQLNAAQRALEIYRDLGVKQIQLDSCSYLILPTLICGGLYTSAIELSTTILRLHGSTSKDVKDHAAKSLRNGLMFKAKEMATFQRQRMRPSLQLLYSKGLVLDAAALMIPGDLGSDSIEGARQKGGKVPLVRLAAEKGFCGSENDIARAEELAIHAEMHFNSPAIIHSATHCCTSIDEFVYSDNRDMNINYFEILHRNLYLTPMEMTYESLRKGHMHSLLIRAIMAVGSANAPKKGKIPKSTEETVYRCQSLRQCLLRAKEFRKEEGAGDDVVARLLWDACLNICEAISTVINGVCGDGDSSTNDTLAEREEAATSFVDSTTQLVQSAKNAFATYCTGENGQSNDDSSRGSIICQYLPDSIAPLYVLLETTARLFSLFGWGKRKRMTKAAAGALANLALSFGELISDFLQATAQYRLFDGSGDINGMSPEVGDDAIQRVVKEVITSRDMTKERVDSFLVQMKDSLESFNEALS